MKTESIHGGKGINVDPKKYEIMKKALLAELSFTTGITFKELIERLEKKVSKVLFPKLGSVGWHAKAVQLDLEKKGMIERIPGMKPLHFRKKKK